MNHILNIFSIFNINLLDFEQFGFSSPFAGGAVLGKMIEFHHSLDFSWCDSPWALFTSGGGWQKIEGTTFIHSQRLGSLVWVLSCSFWLGLNRGCSPLPSTGVSCSHGLICVHLLPWVFIPLGLLLVNIFFFGFLHKYLQWAFLAMVTWYFFFAKCW